ncbi:hypothetical protein SY212_03640 [Ligilactobacillus agilis]|uniref:Uncharacterized protein n=1 Tax=Ligilactobacillus agilis TaxID=1601 RepID=A0A6F9XJ96_9LACO|nr:hypothetical protein [Ligilactobacillus agilis]GET05334.1 hypothetical protein SY212_03640 [Ligilactobacillus agilis]
MTKEYVQFDTFSRLRDDLPSWDNYFDMVRSIFIDTLYEQDYWNNVINNKKSMYYLARKYDHYQFSDYVIDEDKLTVYATFAPETYFPNKGWQYFTAAINCRPYLHNTYYLSIKLHKQAFEAMRESYNLKFPYWTIEEILKNRHCKVRYDMNHQPILYYKYDATYCNEMPEVMFDHIANTLKDLQVDANLYWAKNVWANAVQNHTTEQVCFDYNDFVIAERIDE